MPAPNVIVAGPLWKIHRCCAAFNTPTRTCVVSTSSCRGRSALWTCTVEFATTSVTRFFTGRAPCRKHDGGLCPTTRSVKTKAKVFHSATNKSAKFERSDPHRAYRHIRKSPHVLTKISDAAARAAQACVKTKTSAAHGVLLPSQCALPRSCWSRARRCMVVRTCASHAAGQSCNTVKEGLW